MVAFRSSTQDVQPVELTPKGPLLHRLFVDKQGKPTRNPFLVAQIQAYRIRSTKMMESPCVPFSWVSLVIRANLLLEAPFSYVPVLQDYPPQPQKPLGVSLVDAFQR